MPGDVVRRLIQGEDSQRGYVTCSQVICHLQVLGTNYVIKDIDSKSLKPFEVSKIISHECTLVWGHNANMG